VERGQFPQLNDSDDLWRILVVITARKAIAQRKRHLSKKRGAGAIRGESVFEPTNPEMEGGIGQVLGESPTPEFQAMMTEQCEQMLALLSETRLRDVALLKLEGHSNDEIADRLGSSTRNVSRLLRQIRAKWGDTP
jgi:DNA-directed RNA polymerase specialized sigma24 family protein